MSHDLSPSFVASLSYALLHFKSSLVSGFLFLTLGCYFCLSLIHKVAYFFVFVENAPFSSGCVTAQLDWECEDRSEAQPQYRSVFYWVRHPVVAPDGSRLFFPFLLAFFSFFLSSAQFVRPLPFYPESNLIFNLGKSDSDI